MNLRERDLDGGEQLVLLEGLHEVGERPGVAGLLDQVPLAERRQDEHGGRPLDVDLPCRRQPVQPGHLDVEDHQVRAVLTHELDGLVAPSCLTDDVEALLLEDLTQVETYDRLVLRDHDGSGQQVRSFAG